MDIINFIVIVVCIGFVCSACKLFLNFEKNKKIVDTVNFYPPEKMNSAELEFYYYGYVTSKGITSLLIYLASKGYLKIEDINEKSGSKREFKIIKLKEYDGNNESERIFFNGLFEKTKQDRDIEAILELEYKLYKGKDVNILEELEKEDKALNYVKKSDLYNHFYTTINKVSSEITSVKNKSKAFSNRIDVSILLILMSIFILTMISLNPIWHNIPNNFYFTILSWPIFFFITEYVLINKDIRKMDKTNLLAIFVCDFTLALIAISITVFLLEILLLPNPIYLLTYTLGIISSIIILIINRKIKPIRTEYGCEILGKIEGFKRFLKVAEKSKLEQLVNENPTYFYDILPYAYVLGISKKWIQKFEVIGYKEPDWFEGNERFSAAVVDRLLINTMTDIERAMVSIPYSTHTGYSRSYSSSGGGFSGGGFSGGGSGGGGGGSW